MDRFNFLRCQAYGFFLDSKSQVNLKEGFTLTLIKIEVIHKAENKFPFKFVETIQFQMTLLYWDSRNDP
uniref:Uncharacterized protein n=1 Tax=Metallosphaera hakonensis JCM 8857 = DSM 7519 TaxID=1293036 RepID=A0A2U9IRK2_9CREN